VTILAVGAHPDDIEFGCAAVLIKEIRRGHLVHMMILSRGEAGSSGTPAEREQESRSAAHKMGATVEFLDFGGDGRWQDSPENRLRFAAAIRTFRPELVLAPDTAENQHPDHSAAGRLVRDACRLARYGGLLPEVPVHRVTGLYYYTITQHIGRMPDLVIDVSDAAAEWEAVMRIHQTQVRTKNYLELQLSAARVLGLSIGVEHAIGLWANDPVRVEALSDLRLSSRNF